MESRQPTEQEQQDIRIHQRASEIRLDIESQHMGRADDQLYAACVRIAKLEAK